MLIYHHSLSVTPQEARWPKKNVFTQGIQNEPPLFCALKGSVKYFSGALTAETTIEKRSSLFSIFTGSKARATPSLVFPRGFN